MKKLLTLLLIVFLGTACNKSTPNFWFTGMQIIDTAGNLTKWYGTADNDWQLNKYTIAPTMLNNLLPDTTKDTANWHNTQRSTVSVLPGTNPIGVDTSNFAYTFQVNFSTKAFCNYMLCDELGTIIYHNQCWGDAGSVYYLNIPLNNTQVFAGNVYRLYYAFSARNNLFFATGWGDIGFCNKQTNSQKVTACF